MSLRDVKIGTRLTIGFTLVVVLIVFSAVSGVTLVRKSREDLTATLTAAWAKENMASQMKALALEQSAVMRNISLRSDLKSKQSDETVPGRSARPTTRPGQDVESEARAGRAQDHRHARQAGHGAGRSLPARARPVDKFPQRGGGRGPHDPARPRRPEVARGAGPPDRDPDEIQPGGAARSGRLRRPPGNDRLRRGGFRGARRGPDRLAHRDQRHRPLREAVAVARRVASGDLTSRIEPKGRDEPAELLAAFAT